MRKVYRRLSNEIWKYSAICNELVFLGTSAQGEIPPHGLSALHRIMWKMVIIAMTKVEFENEPFNYKKVWNLTYRRYILRTRALHAAHESARFTAITFERTPPSPHSINKWMQPLASCDDDGILSWHPAWIRLGKNYDVHLPKTEWNLPFIKPNIQQVDSKPTKTAVQLARELKESYARCFVKEKKKKRIIDDDE